MRYGWPGFSARLQPSRVVRLQDLGFRVMVPMLAGNYARSRIKNLPTSNLPVRNTSNLEPSSLKRRASLGIRNESAVASMAQISP